MTATSTRRVKYGEPIAPVERAKPVTRRRVDKPAAEKPSDLGSPATTKKLEGVQPPAAASAAYTFAIQSSTQEWIDKAIRDIAHVYENKPSVLNRPGPKKTLRIQVERAWSRYAGPRYLDFPYTADYVTYLMLLYLDRAARPTPFDGTDRRYLINRNDHRVGRAAQSGTANKLSLGLDNVDG
jgi:hypothetical protein